MMLKIMSPALTSALNSRPTDPKFFTRGIMCTCLHDQLGTQPVPYYMYTTMCKSPMWAWWGGINVSSPKDLPASGERRVRLRKSMITQH